jgi:hypothetical protein
MRYIVPFIAAFALITPAVASADPAPGAVEAQQGIEQAIAGADQALVAVDQLQVLIPQIVDQANAVAALVRSADAHARLARRLAREASGEAQRAAAINEQQWQRVASRAKFKVRKTR